MKQGLFTIILFFQSLTIAYAQGDNYYSNPVINLDTADPTIILGEDGAFYLYSTQSRGKFIPIWKSTNLVDWEDAGAAFTRETRPTFEPKGGLWAPEISYINGKYVLHYAMSKWGGEWTCGIGCATSDKPEGPFTDHGKMFRSEEIGVQNSIDPFYIEEDGKHYLFWGSFRGLYYIELENDGLSVKKGAKPIRIAGTAFEAIYIHKRGGYYYMFASIGSCCEGDNSTYTTVVGRSESLLGTYVDKNGKSMLDNGYEVVIHSNDKFVGTGHNAALVTDKAGDDWILYHSFIRGERDKGRVLLLDRIIWENDWPAIESKMPSLKAKRPVF